MELKDPTQMRNFYLYKMIDLNHSSFIQFVFFMNLLFYEQKDDFSTYF